MLNRIILIGRLTRDPELRFTPANGVPVAQFTIAVDRPFVNQKGERETDFIRIVAWRKLAEICANNLTKGRLVAVDGRLQIRSYDGQDGQRRYITEVVADTVQFLDRAKSSSNEQSSDNFDADFSFDPGIDDINGDGVPF
ncbi:MAG: single-stranded DNA-binding protein [Tepidanaerobacter acetatoxydans]|uniref:single-stranded DNA-binding protein n=1 Tax=Tepidanaerobacter TaxID=499228 RepID=UPI000AB26E1F|nr:MULTISPECIES: single-stranded DNA-binding protein [Tepidanaerobacter]NLU10425.1 single-stranded DNA-binding protein [Tepidanaerobacter acetatoxydans]